MDRNAKISKKVISHAPSFTLSANKAYTLQRSKDILKEIKGISACDGWTTPHSFGTLLIIDETHTICAGPEGLTGAWNLEPDIFTLGKAIAGGFPAAVMGLSRELSERFLGGLTSREWGMGLGVTLSSNALAVAALRATLEHVMTDSAYDYMIQLAEQLEDGIDRTIKTWHLLISVYARRVKL